MKTKEEIEQLAEKLYFHVDGFEEEISEGKRHYILGYTQCQKDIFNELNEWIEITLSAKSKLGASDNVIEALLNVKYKIESLNKKD